MKILALEVECKDIPDDAFKPFLVEEAKRVWELQHEDIIRKIYFRQDRPAAVLMLECASPVDARKILNTLTLVQEKMIDFDVIPLKNYPGLSRLFNE